MTHRHVVVVVLTIGTCWTAETRAGGQAALSGPRAPATPATGQERPAARPIDPANAILEAFRTHALVAIADSHGNEQTHAFRLALIRNPRMADIVNDVVVEFGTVRYQDTIDRFVRGDDVPDDALRRVWQDTTQTEFAWDLPIYEEFFRAIRALNATRPPDRHLRVVLGDPPMDWENVRGTDDYLRRMRTVDRDAHAVEVIRREVLAKHRRALIIYGGQHLMRKNANPNAPDDWARGLVAQLERPGITSVFTVNPETRAPLSLAQADITSWPTPSLARLKGTALGQMRVTLPMQRPVPAEDQFDAIVYLGPPSAMTTAQLSRALCADQVYLQMRLSRLGLIGPPPGAAVTPTDLLKRSCAAR